MPHPSEVNLASYALRSSSSGHRVHAEPQDPLRTPFELDRHRIIESTSFRRLEGKTQVFAPSHNDHFRTRLTHTLETAQIARTLTVALQANEQLAEAISLAHDLGHPPFGHAGEAALDEAMADSGGFNHNAHSVRVVEYLEHPFPPFRGLNLTRATRDGLLAHATRYDRPDPAADLKPRGSAQAARAEPLSPRAVRQPDHHTAPTEQSVSPACPSVESQTASIADRIAYNCHDLEDAIGAKFTGLEQLAGVALWRQAYERVAAGFAPAPIHAVRRVVLDAVLDTLLANVVETSRDLLAALPPPRHLPSTLQTLVALSESVDADLKELEQFLIGTVYRHPKVAAMDANGRRMVLALFDMYRANPEALPRRFSVRIEEQGKDRVICDYIAGMTDRFCTTQHDRHAPSRNPKR